MPELKRVTFYTLIFFAAIFSHPSTSVAGTAETFYHGTQPIWTQLFIQQSDPPGYGDEWYFLTTAQNSQYAEFTTINHRFPSTYRDRNDYWSAAEYPNTNGNEIKGDQVGLDVHFVMGVVHNFLTTQWGNSHYAAPGLVSYVNVPHDSSEGAAYIPQGNKINFFVLEDQPYSPATFIDVVAHEYFHALMNHKGPPYYFIATIQESLADIFSALVQHHYNEYYNGNTDIWMYSRYPKKNHYPGKDLRDMADPKAGIPEDPKPDTIYGSNWGGGLYNNTGVFNHWAYLVSEGSSATDEVNDNGESFQVQGQGIDKLSEWMSKFLSSANFLEIQAEDTLHGHNHKFLRDQFTQAAIKSGEMSISQNDLARATVNASHAVGLFGPLKPPTDLSAQKMINGDYLVTWNNFVWNRAGYTGIWHENYMMGSMTLQTRLCKKVNVSHDPRKPTEHLSDETGCIPEAFNTLETFDYLPWSETPGVEIHFVNLPSNSSDKIRQFRLTIDDYFGRQVKTLWF